ncbi:MAG: SDR family NAD(P)-dependent oxidoreductase, partial [Bacteroidetes bacterium]|nr:SDR family NAD(P)-dependent oxidoreductase [Bacteroidota bacterium]
MLDKFSLRNRTALVTGSNQGIGKAYAIALAEAGADIIAVSYSGNFSEVEAEVNSRGRKFKSYTSDFSDRGSLYKFIKNVKSDFPKIDILVNNAGTILRKPISEHPDDPWDKVTAVT